MDARAASSAPSPAPSSTSAGGASLTTFGIQPQGLGKVDPRGYFSYSATPGAHLEDHAAVKNYSYTPIVLRINVADAENTSTGGFALTSDSQSVKDVGAWISFPARYATITVPARTATKVGEVDVPMSVKIPADATPGDHVGGITVSLDSLATSLTGQKYKLVQRVGARVFVRVIGPLRPRLSIENLSVQYHYAANPFGSGSATISYTVHNTGNVALGGSPGVTVTGLLGATAAAQHLTPVPLLLPGFAVRQTVTVTGITAELWETAKVTVAPLKLAGSVLPPAGPWTATTTFWAVPLWLLLILALLVLLGAGELYLRRLRQRPGPPHGLDDPGTDPAPNRPDRSRAPEKALS